MAERSDYDAVMSQLATEVAVFSGYHANPDHEGWIPVPVRSRLLGRSCWVRLFGFRPFALAEDRLSRILGAEVQVARAAKRARTVIKTCMLVEQRRRLSARAQHIPADIWRYIAGFVNAAEHAL